MEEATVHILRNEENKEIQGQFQNAHSLVVGYRKGGALGQPLIFIWVTEYGPFRLLGLILDPILIAPWSTGIRIIPTLFSRNHYEFLR